MKPTSNNKVNTFTWTNGPIFRISKNKENGGRKDRSGKGEGGRSEYVGKEREGKAKEEEEEKRGSSGDKLSPF